MFIRSRRRSTRKNNNLDPHSWIVNSEESVEPQATGQVSEEGPMETPAYSRDTNTSGVQYQ